MDDYSIQEYWWGLYNDNISDILGSLRSKERISGFLRVPPLPYKKALDEFSQYGRLMRFPVRYIYLWKSRVLRGIVRLRILTEICGHTQWFPVDEWNDYYFTEKEESLYISNYSEAVEIIESNGLYGLLPEFSNGQTVLSDYGLDKLEKLAYELIGVKSPEGILVILNKVMNVVHQRSDLAELFIIGGSSNLTSIENDTL